MTAYQMQPGQSVPYPTEAEKCQNIIEPATFEGGVEYCANCRQRLAIMSKGVLKQGARGVAPSGRER